MTGAKRPHWQRPRNWLLLAAALLMAALFTGSGEAPAQMVVSRVELDMPQQDAWARLSDLGLAHHYVPGIIRTEITTEQATGEGASRRVYSGERRYMNETVVEWREGAGLTLLLHDDDGGGPMPFREAEFEYRLQASGEGRSVMEVELRFTLRGGALGAWAGRTLLAGAMQSRIDAVARGLKRFYEEQP